MEENSNLENVLPISPLTWSESSIYFLDIWAICSFCFYFGSMSGV